MTILLTSKPAKIAGLLCGVVLLIGCIIASIVFGIIDTNWNVMIDAFTNYNGSNEHIVIKEVRLPRALIASAVGASLGVCGVLLQALTRNPLADTGILGLNGGAAICIVIAVSYFSIQSLSEFVWVAFIGAGISGLIVFFLGALGKSGLTPVRITIAGAAIAAFTGSMTHAVLILNEKALEDVLFWLAGSVQGRDLSMLWNVLPFMIPAWLIAIGFAGPLNTLMLGDDIAKGLGQNVAAIKIAVGLLIIILAGSSVAVAGPIAFVSLVTPHIAKWIVGYDIRWTILFSGLIGSILLLIADILARFVAMPGELPVGVMTALIGTPFFIYAARKGLAKS